MSGHLTRVGLLCPFHLLMETYYPFLCTLDPLPWQTIFICVTDNIFLGTTSAPLSPRWHLAATWEILSQNHLAQPFLDSWPPGMVRDNKYLVFFLKLLSLRLPIAIGNHYSAQELYKDVQWGLKEEEIISPWEDNTSLQRRAWHLKCSLVVNWAYMCIWRREKKHFRRKDKEMEKRRSCLGRGTISMICIYGASKRLVGDEAGKVGWHYTVKHPNGSHFLPKPLKIVILYNLVLGSFLFIYGIPWWSHSHLNFNQFLPGLL